MKKGVMESEASMPEARVVLSIRGRVQGVFFRATARKHARKLGIVGFVQNRPNGTVHLVGEGKRDNLEQLIAWCRKGPPLARVDEVTVEWEEPKGAFAQFRIR